MHIIITTEQLGHYYFHPLQSFHHLFNCLPQRNRAKILKDEDIFQILCLLLLLHFLDIPNIQFPNFDSKFSRQHRFMQLQSQPQRRTSFRYNFFPLSFSMGSTRLHPQSNYFKFPSPCILKESRSNGLVVSV